MPSIRLSSEALNFLKQARNQNAAQRFKPIVSIVQDEDESDVESEDEEASAVVLTPRLKAHTRKIYDLPSDEAIPGKKAFQPAPVSNLSKRFSSTSLNTPSRILQLALERKSSSEDNDKEEKKKEHDLSISDSDVDTRHSRKEVARQPSPAETTKKGPATRRRVNKEQPPEVLLGKKAEFKVPQQTKRKKNTEPLEKQISSENQPRVTRRHGKKKQLEEADVPQASAASDDSEPQAANISTKRPKRGQKAKETQKKTTTTTNSPSALVGVQITVENFPTVGVRRDVLLLDDAANNSRNARSIDDKIDSVINNIAGNQKSSVKGVANSRKRKKTQEIAEGSEDNVEFVTKRRGRPNKETPPVKRPIRNKSQKAASRNQTEKDEDQDLEAPKEKPEDGDGEASTSTNPIVPDFSSDHEEDRSPMSSPSRDSPIITKTNRLSRVLINKSPSYDNLSDGESYPDGYKLSTIPSRSSSSSPDMFTPSPRSKEPFNQRESRASSESEKFTTKLSIPLESSAVTRGRRRASVGAAAKSSVASSDQVTTFSIEQTTPLQLEAVGLLRKPTPQSARSQTPPHKSLPSTVTTPLSSRNRGRTGPENQIDNGTNIEEKPGALKRKQAVEASKTTPKRQRVQKISPKKVQEQTTSEAASPLSRKRSRSISPTKKIQKSAYLEAQISPLITFQRAQNLSPEKVQEPLSLETRTSSAVRKHARNASPQKIIGPSNAGTPQSASTHQRAQNLRRNLLEPPNINTEETLPCTANSDLHEIENLTTSAISLTSKVQQSKLPHSDECTLEQTIAKTNVSGHSSVISLATQPTRFNAYSANPDDPVRATQLLATEEYCVSWLHILPRCSFYFRIRSQTTIMIISGTILINGDPNHSRDLVLNSQSRVADLSVGSLCQAVNTGDTPAIFQVTESLS